MNNDSGIQIIIDYRSSVRIREMSPLVQAVIDSAVGSGILTNRLKQ
jgi:hypothetical protein